MIADIPQITVDGVVYVIEASNNLKSRIDAIVQETPEVADELGDVKPLILNSGSTNSYRGHGMHNNSRYAGGHYNNGHRGQGRGHQVCFLIMLS